MIVQFIMYSPFAIVGIYALYVLVRNRVSQTRKSRNTLEWENFELQLRINKMEEQICPNHKHRWRRERTFFDENYQLQNRYVCGRCGKVVVTPLSYVEEPL